MSLVEQLKRDIEKTAAIKWNKLLPLVPVVGAASLAGFGAASGKSPMRLWDDANEFVTGDKINRRVREYHDGTDGFGYREWDPRDRERTMKSYNWDPRWDNSQNIIGD